MDLASLEAESARELQAERDHPRPPISASAFQWFLAFHVVVLSAASLYLIDRGAGDEPYVSFRSSDALEQIGFGSVLMAAWVYVIVCCIWGVCTRRLLKSWLFVVAWGLLALSYLRYCPFGFVEDIVHFSQPQ